MKRNIITDNNNLNICCIFNLAAHYRAPIYKLMDQELKCDFYIGDKLPGNIKKMNYNSLNGYKKSLKNIKLIGNYYWQVGAITAVLKPYKNIIMCGEPYCISNWFILILAKLLNKKTFLWTHGWYGRETPLKKLVKKLFFSLSYKILLYGDYARELMIKEGLSPDKLVPIYNSLNYHEQYVLRKKLKPTNIYHDYFRNSYPVILYIGRIQKVKKIELLIDALKCLNKAKFFCNLILIGEDEENVNLDQKVMNINLQDKVWFYGSCYDEKKISELIFNADVTVSPGNVGLTAIHSLTYGTPVITHDNFSKQGPEFEVIKKGLTGDFFKEGSLKDITAKIEEWIDLPVTKRNVIREKCYEIIDQKYTPEKQIIVLKNILNI